MSEHRRATETIKRVAGVIVRLLQAQESASTDDVIRAANVSRETVKRAREWLHDQGAPIDYDNRTRVWRLLDRGYTLPFLDPSPEDLYPALMTAGLLEALRQPAAASRAWALFDEIDIRLHGGRGRAIRQDALRVTQSASLVREPRWVLDLLRAARRSVLRVSYRSPWKNEVGIHIFEPWQVCLHEGIFYARGHSRTRNEARTLRLACIEEIKIIAGENPRAAVPATADLWGGGDPRFGIDEDRPGDAVIRWRGAVARWVFGSTWHPEQQDSWLDDGEMLERRMPYRSCRELARKLVAYADGLDSVEPPELRDEVLRIASEGLRRLRG